jgi:hypothetical protein
MTPRGDEAAASAVKIYECTVKVHYTHRFLTIYNVELGDVPIVEKNDLSPHSATKTKTNVLATVLAADMTPAPFPENFETASSAYKFSTGYYIQVRSMFKNMANIMNHNNCISYCNSSL